MRKLFFEAKCRYKDHPFFSRLFPVISSAEIHISGQAVKTAAIKINDGAVVIHINPSFASVYVKNPEDILFLLSHEICHYILGHLFCTTAENERIYGEKQVNLALDIVINRMLYAHLGKKADDLALPLYYRQARCPVRLLMPPSICKEEEFAEGKCRELFRQLRDGKPMTTYRLLKHISSHEEFDYRPIFELIFTMEGFSPKGPLAGKMVELGNLILAGMGEKTVRSPLKKRSASPRARLMRVIREMAEEGGGRLEEVSRGGGILPSSGRRDFLSLALRKPVIIYHANPHREEERGVRVYLDVSGSMSEDLPMISSLLASVKDYIAYPLYGFSTRVYPVTKKKLILRMFTTHGATLFDCFAEHAIKHRHEKILLITDGEGTMSRENQKRLKAGHEVVTLLTKKGRSGEVEKFSREVVSI